MIIISIVDIFLEIILILFLALFGILLLILIIPFKYRISALLKEKADFYFHVYWAMLEVELFLKEMKPFVKVRIFRRIIVNEPLKKKPRKESVKKAEGSDFKMPGMGFFKEVLKFLQEVFNLFKPKEITAFGFYGLDDPVHTAQVSFMINLFSGLFPQAKIGLEPIFDSEAMDVEIKISGSIRLMGLLGILIKYIFRREVRQVVFKKTIKTKT